MKTFSLSLFEDAPPPRSEIWAPQVILDALAAGATLVISISGGKDSQALLTAVVRWFRANQFPGALLAVHADLGRAEWPQTLAHVRRLCEALGVPLRIVHRAKGDLLARIGERLEATQGTETPFWPSATNRYCTSHLKSGPIDQELRKPFWPSPTNRYCTSDLKRGPIDGVLRAAEIVVSAEGVRADESAARAKKSVVEVRKGITAGSNDATRNLRAMAPDAALESRQDGQRVALNWRPLFHWSEADIWAECGTSQKELKRRQMLHKTGNEAAALEGWPCHPAYVWGNQRLSCALCVLAGPNDLLNGANHNPEIYREYLELEVRGGATFKHGWSLSELPVVGYHVDFQVVNAAWHGAATSRERLFVQAIRRRKPRWPERTHYDPKKPALWGEPYRPARDVIDWSLRGKSIFGRERPLSPKTMTRIFAGLKKFNGIEFVLGQQSCSAPRSLDDVIPTIATAGAISLVEPFFVVFRNNATARSIDELLPTITTTGKHVGICEPYMVRFNGDHAGRNDGAQRGQSLDSPLGTLDTSNRYGLCEPFLFPITHTGDGRSRLHSVDLPLPTVTTAKGGEFALCEPYLVKYYGTGLACDVDEPLPTVTTNDRFGLAYPWPLAIYSHEGALVALMDVLFRMLEPHELAAAMGMGGYQFPQVLKKTKSREYYVEMAKEHRTKMIGNAVEVNTARALCREVLQ